MRQLWFVLFAATLLGCGSTIDVGNGGQSSGGAPDAGPVAYADSMRVFVTSAAYTGDLRSAGGGATGLQSADALCKAAADGASLGGSWVAWLSDDAVDAIDRIADDGPWVSIDRTAVVFSSRASVGAASPVELKNEHGAPALDGFLGKDEFGHTVPSSAPATFWTGTLPSGRSSGNDCARWTDGSLDSKGTTASYLGVDSVTGYCEHEQHLLCLEQKTASPAVAPPKRVFVTSKRFEGDLVSEGNKGTPQASADGLCAAAANDAGLGGNWTAWLSARDASGKMMRAFDRLTSDVSSWTLVDKKTVVFEHKSDLLGMPVHAIDMNEFGARVSDGSTFVWTGTLQGGAPASVNTCSNFTSKYEGDWGIVGYVASSSLEQWSGPPSDIESASGRCSDLAHLYCFEQ